MSPLTSGAFGQRVRTGARAAGEEVDSVGSDRATAEGHDRASIFRSNLRSLLVSRWLTQRRAADEIGVSYKWMRRLCHRGVERLDRRTEARLHRVADFFGVRVGDLWGNHLGAPARPRRDRNLVKWTGSKRRQAPKIVALFPKQIDTYYEPFLGGGSVLYELLGSDIGVKRFRCSDTCATLIGIWEMVRDVPEVLLRRYEGMWAEVRRRGADFYYELRAAFNKTQDPCMFFWLLRTCRNGLVRFNKNGQFTTGFHYGRSGVEPQEVHALLQRWAERLAGRDTRFEVKDYREVRSRPGDLLFVDPPYDVPDPEIYSGMIDFNVLFDWLGRQRGGYILTLNGFVGDEDRRVAVPPHLYDEHLQLEGRGNPLVPGGDRRVTDALYLKLDGRSPLARHPA